MPNCSSNLLPSNVTKTLVCIDTYYGADLGGRMYNPYLDGCVTFSGIYGMIHALEDFFDEIGFPQAFFRFRTFSGRKRPTAAMGGDGIKEVIRYMDDSIFSTEQGQRATFVVQVHFRQNATWQGTISWAEEKKSQQFRSTLEMVKLMDDALSGKQDLTVNWEDD